MMSLKKILPLLLVATVVGIVITFVQHQPDQDSRVVYEAFLHQAMKEIPDHEVKLKDIPKADRPDVAAIQNYFQTLDPDLGYVPLKRQYAAYMQTQQQAQKGNRNLTISWQGQRADMGGRTRAIMFDPNDIQDKAVFAAGVTGGLFYNYDITNLNSDWESISDFMPNMAISSLAYDPNNTMTLYAGTGEAQTARVIYRESTGLGMGIMKSTDGGFTWELIPSTADFAYITDVKVRSEAGESVIYAAVVSGDYQGVLHESAPSDGLYRSTDEGETWQQVLPEIPGQSGKFYAPAQIEITASNRIFIGTMENLELKGGAVILWSDSGLPGSWTANTSYNTMIQNESYYKIPARTLVASAPSDPNVIYAQFSAGYNDGFNYYRGRYMAKSTDAGATWSPINIPSTDWSTLAWHAFVLKVDPTNPNMVFSGGLDLWKSSTGGQNWTKISDWSLMYYGGGDEYVHADQHNIQFRPNHPQQALFASDGGVFLSNNAHLTIPTFVERNQNFNTLPFYSCAINPVAGSEQYVGGLQDNGSLKFTANTLTINDMYSGGDGAACFWDQNEPNLFITSVYYNAYYIFKNNNYYDYVDAGNGTFVSPADFDYRSNTLYANAVSFAGSNPGTLTRISGIGGESGLSEINLGTANNIPFSYVGYSQHSPAGTAHLFVGTQSGRLYKVTNAQDLPIVTDIGTTAFPTANISSVAIGGSEDSLLVTFSNYGVSSIWQTWDGGMTWQEKEGNLPDMPIRWALYHPQNSGQAMIATETGIWTTNTLHESNTLWQPAAEGMGNVRVDMLRLRESDNTVIAASHGRGMFTTTWNIDIYTGINENKTNQLLGVSPNPAINQITVRVPTTSNKEMEYKIVAMDGSTVLSGRATIDADSKTILTVGSLQTGTFFLHFADGQRNLSAKLVKR